MTFMVSYDDVKLWNTING